MSTPPLTLTAMLLLLGALALPASAEPLPYNRVALDVSAQAEVDNDELVAVLTAQAEGNDVATPADTVNRRMDWAVNVARGVPGVKVQTLGYSSQPVYDKQKIRAWRVSQSLRLESSDSTLLGDLVARLQEELRVQSLSYRVSTAVREAHTDTLTTDALARFRARADAVSKALGRSGYRIVRLQINDGQSHPAPVMRGMMMEVASSDSMVAPARIEAGTQTLQVTINGEIELDEK